MLCTYLTHTQSLRSPDDADRIVIRRGKCDIEEATHELTDSQSIAQIPRTYLLLLLCIASIVVQTGLCWLVTTNKLRDSMWLLYHNDLTHSVAYRFIP